MRSSKPGDSPSGATRDVYPIRGRASVLSDYFDPIHVELHRLVQQEPGLAFAGPDVLFARMVTPETAPDYASCLRRAAFGVLLVRAIDRAEQASPTTGDAA